MNLYLHKVLPKEIMKMLVSERFQVKITDHLVQETII